MGYSSTQKGESFFDQVHLAIVETSPTSVSCSQDTTSSSEGTTSNSKGAPSSSVQTKLINPSTLPSLVEEIQVESGNLHQNSRTMSAVLLGIQLKGNNMGEIHKLKPFLYKKFAIKDLGSFKYFLRIEIASSSKGLFLNQCKYVLDLLQETGMLETKPFIIPIDCKAKLGLDGELLADASYYLRLVGRLIYLTVTCADICYAVSLVSQFIHSPRSTHLQAIKRILHYLKGSISRGILIRENGDS
ncbi:unnamed protein product [Prunus armeniaca]